MSTKKIVEELEFELNEINNLLDLHLKWSEMEHLVMHIQQTWEKFKTEILSFN